MTWRKDREWRGAFARGCLESCLIEATPSQQAAKREHLVSCTTTTPPVRGNMAPKQGDQGGGMANYVLAKDAAGTGTGKIDSASREILVSDLKVSVRGSRHNSQPANSRQPRVQRSDALPHKVQAEQQRLGGQYERNIPVWNAGNSSIGDSSETPSAIDFQQPQASAADELIDSDLDSDHVSRPHADRQSPAGEPGFSEKAGEDDVDLKGQRNIMQDPLHGYISQAASDIMTAAENTGPSFPHVSGDSYPSTTSGPSSIQVMDDQHHVQNDSEDEADRFNGPTSMPVPHAHQQPFAGHRKYTQKQAQQAHYTQPRRMPAPDAAPSANMPIRRPDTRDQSQQVARNSQFDAAPLAKAGRTTLDNEQGQEVAMVRRRRQPARTDEAVPKHTEKADRKKADLESTQDRIWHPGAQQHQQQKRDFPGDPKGAAPNLATGSENIHAVAQAQSREAAHNDVEKSSANVAGDLETAFGRESPVELDYDTSELQRMEFSALKRQSFDVDPRQDEKAFPGVETSDSIAQQMEAAAALGPGDKHELLATLPIDEWEEAGEWFLSKFNNTMLKLKNLRQEKRKAARAFEEQIQGRHAAVVKKRKATEAAFAAMRTNGKTILDSTPKKARTLS